MRKVRELAHKRLIDFAIQNIKLADAWNRVLMT